MTDTAANKQVVQTIFDGLARGDARPFVEAMAEDFRWTMTGTTRWSGTYEGKKEVVGRLFAALRAKMPAGIRTIPQRLIAEGDMVVVEARGDNVTADGKRYDNTYCFVCRLENGKLQEITEYFDSELVTAALGDPEWDRPLVPVAGT
jgi:ketosteroid isomerase-like protein